MHHDIERIGVSERNSRAVVYGELVFLPGIVPGDNPPSLDIADQARLTLEKVEKQLQEAGSSKEKLLMATVYLRDINDFGGFNAVWNNWIAPGHPPARTCVQACMSRQNNLCEITVVAARG